MGGLPGYDAAIQAMSGLMSINGEADGAPTRLGVPMVDIVTGMNAAIGILLALQERHRSQRGQFIDITLFDSALSILHPQAANYFADGQTPQRTGNAHPNITPYDVFPTASEPIFLAVGNDRQFLRLCEILEVPSIAQDPRFTSNDKRTNNRTALRTLLANRLKDYDGHALAEQLMREGVPCSSVLTVPQAMAHPHTQHREMVIRQGDYQGIASPIKLSRTPARFYSEPPVFEEHQLAFDF